MNQPAAPSPVAGAAARRHHLTAAPEHLHWGYWDAALAPVLRVQPGDIVDIDCLTGGADDLPPPELGYTVLPEHHECHQRVAKGTGAHILTGPVYVEGARPGDVLEVRIHDIRLRQDWGWNIFRGLMGTLPDQFPYARRIHLGLDAKAMTAKMPWGQVIPIRPFFGQLGVAPRPEYGRQNSKEPREFGGNLDNRELIAGTTVYLPVWNEGALFSTGDGHAAQGDGEVCGTAIETSLAGTFEFHVRRDVQLARPFAETPTHLVTMGLHADLDDAVEQALSTMLDFLVQRLGISRADAYSFASFVVDLRITQTVNNVKGVHAMIDRKLLVKG